MTPQDRHGGYAPISDYAVLGDGRTAALAASDGRIDWWAIPALDAPPVCAAILDPDGGGSFILAPEDPADVSRRYLPGTNVLETTYVTRAGTVQVTDCLNVGSAGRLPWTELARRAEGLTGEVAMRWEFRPGDRFGQARPWVTLHGQVPVVTDGDQNIALVVQGGGTSRAGAHHVGRGRTGPDRRSGRRRASASRRVRSQLSSGPR